MTASLIVALGQGCADDQEHRLHCATPAVFRSGVCQASTSWNQGWKREIQLSLRRRFLGGIAREALDRSVYLRFSGFINGRFGGRGKRLTFRVGRGRLARRGQSRMTSLVLLKRPEANCCCTNSSKCGLKTTLVDMRFSHVMRLTTNR